MKASSLRKQHMLCAAFLLAEAVLFAWILVTTFFSGGGGTARYLMIVVCAVFALFLLLLKRQAEQAFLLCAFLFSAAADWFLVFRPEMAVPAVGLFSIAQLFHALRIAVARGSVSKKWLAVRIMILAAGLLAAAALKVRETLIYFGIFYILNLIVNLMTGLALSAAKPRYAGLPAGLFLFILCDVTVGINGMGASWGFPEKLIRTAADLTYVFYVPSQVLIALAGLTFRKRTA